MSTKPKIIFLAGPTAIGKTDIAVKLARKINAEIISCDSMQVYKGMDILTSKPKAAAQRLLPHHLIDLIQPNREYNVSKYRKEAMRKIKEMINRGKTPLFVGGTGLYMSALIYGIFEFKSEDKAVRERLYALSQKRKGNYLYKKLKKVDPQSAARIHPNDTKRIVRALEVFETTGKSISFLQKQRKGLSDKYDIKIFCLDMPRDELYSRIDKRTETMFKKGLAGEVKKLLKLKLSRTASYAIGIRELKGYFDGWYNLDEAKQLIKRNTRQYAKRQLTWFRKDKMIEWIKISEKEKPDCIASKILKGFSLA